MPRSESEKLAMAPIVVKFGEKNYDIPLLKVLAQRAWRLNLVEQLGDVLNNFGVSTDSTTAFSAGLVSALVKSPEKLTDLLFAYAPSLPKQEILDSATEEQILIAFSEVMAVAFPFMGLLGMMTQMIKADALSSPKPASTRLH